MAGRVEDRCTRAREWASLRTDGELSELERLLLRRHLSRCSGCRTFAQTLAAATGAIRSTPLERPSRSLAPDPAPARPRARRRRRVAVAVALVGVAAASGGVVGGLLGGSEGQAPAKRPPDIALLKTHEHVTPRPPGRPIIAPPGEPV